MNEVKHKTAAEFWEERFGESPQNDAEKLAVAMMTEYADYVCSQLDAHPDNPKVARDSYTYQRFVDSFRR